MAVVGALERSRTVLNSRLHVIELNEFNSDLLRRAAAQFGLGNITSVLRMAHGKTLADQKTEHQGLDPWVQWVSVHTGVPSHIHRIMRLGDALKLRHAQVWERLSARSITTGVWGVMNATRGQSKDNQFFVADPWSTAVRPFPESLESFLALPCHYARHYMSLSPGALLLSGFRTLFSIFRNVPLWRLAGDIWFLARYAPYSKLNSRFLVAAFELMSARVYSRFWERYQPDVSIFFVNAVAHFQHHDRWGAQQGLDATAEFVFRTIDRILSIVLPPASAADQVIVLNGLGQRSLESEDMYCYRQISPARFLRRIGLDFLEVEQCMTNDGHVRFRDPRACGEAAALLRAATMNGRAVFFVEIDADDTRRLFYQLDVSSMIDPDAILHFPKFELPFFSEFAVHAKQTGAHVETGEYYVRGASLPPVVKNHEIFSRLLPALD